MQCWGNLCNIGTAFAAASYYQKINRSKKNWQKMMFREQCTEFFSVQCCLESLGHHTGFLPVQCCPKNIMTTLNKIFYVQCCLEPLGHHCTGFLPVPVQCCPKRIMTTGKRIFSCLMLSELSRTTLCGIFPLQYCPRSIKTTMHRIFFLFNFAWSLLGNIVQGFYLYNVVPRVLRQH